MKYFLLSITLLLSLFTYSQSTGSIVGKLIDKEYNNEPLAFANVIIKGTTNGTTSDMDGLYAIENLSPGSYTIIYSFVGYETQEIEVDVIADKAIEIDVILAASAASLDEVVITTSTKRESETALLLDQKKAVEIKQSIGAEELSRKGVSDAAGAVAKISGVSKQEGSSNVYVRGLGDRYLNTTMNGLSLPSNDVNKKNIDLNLFSSDVIQNVSISKAYSSKFYSDFSAGNVDITSKEYKGNGFFEAFTSSGFNTNAVDKSFVRSEGTGYFGYYGRYEHNPFAVILSHGIDPESASTPINIAYGASTGKSFSFKNGSKLSLFATASFENAYEFREGSSVDYTLTEKKAFIDNAEEYEYATTSTVMANVNYRIDDISTLKFNSLFINSSTDEVSYFGIDGKGRNRDGIASTDEGFYQMNVQFDQTKMFVNQLSGKHKSGKFDINWGFGYNKVFSDQPDRKRISLENYHLNLDNDPSTNAIFYNNVDFDNQRYFQNIEDEEFNGFANLAYEANENLKFNFGYNGRSKERAFNNYRYGYRITDADYAVTDVNNFNSIFNLNNLQINEDDGGVYEIKVIRGIPIDPNDPTQGTYGTTNRPGLAENTYQGNLNVYAIYADAEIKVSEKWLFVPGMRVESVDQKINYDVINLGNNGKDEKRVYENFYLPSLNVKYALNDDANLRFSASQTVSIPEFKEIAPFVYEDISTRIGGNPDILGSDDPTFINVSDVSYSKILNIDLKYEWFYSKNEILSAALFTKQINDPINLVVVADATGTQRFVRTGKRAEVYGIEVELRKNLITVDDAPKLALGFNATYMHTQQDLYDEINGTFDLTFQEDSEELQGASPLILNADINYSPTFGNYKPVANLVFSYFSDRIDALGSGQLGNVIEKGVPTLDFIWKNSFKEHFEINLSAKNLFNPNIKYIRETTLGDVVVNSANGKGVSDYKRGMNIGLQLKYKF